MKHPQHIIIFTDGSSRGNPGPGGWGAVILNKEKKITEIGGREDHTTNNRMELSAALESLRFIEERKLEGDIEVHTDSNYVLKGITGWVYGWEKNGWKTGAGEPVLNQDLWKELGAVQYRMKRMRNVEWIKVGGHAGIAGNERADVIATEFADNTPPLLFIGSLADYEKILGASFLEPGFPSEVLKSSKKKKNSAPGYSYVSLIKGKIAVDKTWAECEDRVKGESGAKYRKAMNKEEEQAIVKEWILGEES